MTTIHARPVQSPPSAFVQVLTALAGGILLFFALFVGMLTVYDVRYFGRVFPGVSVAGVDVSGMNPQQAAVKLSQSLAYPNAGKILLRDGERM